MDAAAIGAKLRDLRTKAGLTQAELAEKAGITVRTVSRLETGSHVATFQVIVLLARSLGTDCREFAELTSSHTVLKTEPQGRGRPKKEAAEPAGPEVKRPRGRAGGRPKKEVSVSEERKEAEESQRPRGPKSAKGEEK